MVDELDASTLPPRRPLAALVIAVQQAWVLIASLQIHPVHALHGDSGRPLGIPLLHLPRSPSIPRRALCGVGRRDVLRHGVPRPTAAHRSRADKDHECRWVGGGGREDFVGVVAGPGAMMCTGTTGSVIHALGPPWLSSE